jgi:hypothetical protein
MRRGIAPERLVLAGSIVMALSAAALFSLASPAGAAALALLSCAVGGLVPAACFALVPASVPAPSLVPPAMGLTIQGNNIVQLLAPPLLGALAGLAWPILALPMLASGAGVAWLALWLRRERLRKPMPPP